MEAVVLRSRIATGTASLDDFIELAQHLERESRLDEAINVYRAGLDASLSLEATAWIAWHLGSLLSQGLGRDMEAVPLAEKTIQLLQNQPDTSDTTLLRGLGYALLARALWGTDAAHGAEAAGQAVIWFERGVQHGTLAETVTTAYREAIWVHSALGEQHRVVELCKEGLRRPQSNRSRTVLLLSLAEALRLCTRTEEAEHAAEEALVISQDDASARAGIYLTLGLIARDANKPEKALEHLRAAVVATTNDRLCAANAELSRSIYGHLASLYDQVRDLPAAVAALTALLEHYRDTDPGRYRLLLWLGDCHLTMGEVSRARACWDEVAESCLAQGDERDGARERLMRLYLQIAADQRAVGENEAARATLEQLLQHAAHFPATARGPYLRNAYAALARIYYGQAKYSETAASCQMLLAQLDEKSPLRPWAGLLLGHSLSALDLVQPAREAYNAVAASAQTSSEYKRAADQALKTLSGRSTQKT